MIPPRILDDNPTEAEARLLRAPQKYRASDKIRRSTLAAVSVVATTGASAQAAEATARTGARALWARAGLATKLVVIGAFSASAFFAMRAPDTWTESGPQEATQERAPERRNPASAESSSTAAEHAPGPATPASPPVDEPAAPAVEPAPMQSARPLPRQAAPRGSHSATGSDDAESLTAEIATVDRAKRALEQKDANGALQTLDEHRRRFRNGALVPEATALRIEALVARGDLPAARRLAEAFLVEHPTSPLGPRIRDLVGAGSEAPGRAPIDSIPSP